MLMPHRSRSLRRALVSLVLLTALVGLYVRRRHQMLSQARLRVDESWSELQRSMHGRADVGVDVLLWVSRTSAKARLVGSELAAARLKLRQVDRPEEAAEPQRRLERALGQLFRIADRDGEPHPSERLGSLREELRRSHAHLMEARRRHAEEVDRYNALLRETPSFVARRWDLGPAVKLPFAVAAASHDGQFLAGQHPASSFERHGHARPWSGREPTGSVAADVAADPCPGASSSRDWHALGSAGESTPSARPPRAAPLFASDRGEERGDELSELVDPARRSERLTIVGAMRRSEACLGVAATEIAAVPWRRRQLTR